MIWSLEWAGLDGKKPVSGVPQVLNPVTLILEDWY
jgi:hypothetical protein